MDVARIEPSHVVIQVSEELATQHLKETKTLQQLLAHLGFEFAVENYGSGRDPAQLISHVPVNYVKIDGSLMQMLATKPPLQEKVRGFIQAATRHSIATMAERVQDANTIAVLFQLGIAYMQGHYVHEPEVVLAEAN